MKIKMDATNRLQRRSWTSLIICAIALSQPVIRPVVAAEPLLNAHAHNDYWHDRPLFNALDQGFTSVEADVYLRDGKLLVGHSRDELKTDKTLQSLYLEPLLRRVQATGKGVFPNGGRFFLLIDFKTDAEATLRTLNSILPAFSSILTTVNDGVVHPRSVAAIVTGNRPRIDLADHAPRYFGLDGRLSDLDSQLPSHVMPMISDNWTSHFSWRGVGAIPEIERRKLREIVQKAHAAGRVVRFWGTPENEVMWQELREADVDLIGTDQLERLATFLRTPRQATPLPATIK